MACALRFFQAVEGVEDDGRWAEVWQTAGDQLVSSRFYTSHEQALADSGLV